MVWLSVAPGTERYRLTDLHRRFNGDMNSASVSSFSTRETRRSVCGGGEETEKTNKRQCSLLHLSSPLLMYSLLSRGEQHSSHAHFSLKLPMFGDRPLLVRWLGRCCDPEMKCMVQGRACLQGLFSPLLLPKHTAVEFNNTTTLHPDRTTTNKEFQRLHLTSASISYFYSR